jgi:UPF0755 protein
MPARKPRRKTSRGRILFLLALLGLAVAVAAVRLWEEEMARPVLRDGAAPRTVAFPVGSSVDAMARQLEDAGAVRHRLVFVAFVRWARVDGRLKAGEYALAPGLTLPGLVDHMTRGEVVRHDITFPEGRSIVDCAAIVAGRGYDREAFLAAARDPSLIRDLDAAAKDLEGYLFPDTYDQPFGNEPEAQLVKRMVARFREVITPELPRVAKSTLSLRQVVSLASIVELETAAPAERPRIAAVFLNRLEHKMLLQTDPSVIYALRLAGRWDGNIRKGDLDIDSPYNTYRKPGLPPGPLASPGRAALLAVLAPAAVRDLYFVSRNDGTHEFSETLEDHNKAVDRYQRRKRG